MTGIAGMVFANRTPPSVSSGDPNWADVKLLLHMDGADNGTTFTDSSTTASVWTALGQSRTDTGEKKFGTASFEMQSISTNTLQTRGIIYSDSATYTNLKMKDNFTFEYFYYTANSGSVKGVSSYGFFSFITYINGTTLTLEISSVTAGVSVVQKSYTAGTISLNTWNHIAICREGANLQVWVNGTRTLNATDMFTNEIRTRRAADTGFTDWFSFGSTNHGSVATTQHLGGWLDEVRITQGIIRYSGATITVPTVAFSDN
jgi:hypothetical protein